MIAIAVSQESLDNHPIADSCLVCGTHNGTTDNSRFADPAANKAKIYCVTGFRHFTPFRLEQFEASSRIDHKVYFPRTVPPEKQASLAVGPAFAIP